MTTFKKIIAFLIPKVLFLEYSTYQWQIRQNTSEVDILYFYWNDVSSINRVQFIKLFKKYLQKIKKKQIRILEFGCYVGVNFALLKKKGLEFYGVEPNQQAVGFLHAKLPQVHLFPGNDKKFCTSPFPNTKMDFSFAYSVFYTLSSSRAKKVFHKLCKISNYVIVADDIDHINGKKTWYKSNEGSYVALHPYRKWFEEEGFAIKEIVPSKIRKTAITGYIVAKRLPSQSE